MIVKVWFKCAAMHDPVCPKIISPCLITWEAKYRDVQVVIERKLKGDELVKRMKGWITIDPNEVIGIVEKYGKFIVNENGELFVELKSSDIYNDFEKELTERFGEEILIEKME